MSVSKLSNPFFWNLTNCISAPCQQNIKVTSVGGCGEKTKDAVATHSEESPTLKHSVLDRLFDSNGEHKSQHSHCIAFNRISN